MADQANLPPYADDPSCSEVYAECTQTLFGAPGMLRIELCVNRWTQHAPVKVRCVVPVVRAALPVEVAKMLRDQLARCLEALEQQAQLAQAPAASPTVQ
jgi:hypothetical protein